MLQRSDASCNATSICHGGLGPGSFTIGVIMTALGVTIGISSAIFFPILLQNIGIYRLHRTAMGYYLVTVASFPVMNLFAKRIGHVDWCVGAILVIQFGGSIASATSYSCLFIYFSNSAPTKSALGVINGLAQTVACSARIFAPLITSSLFSLTHQHNLLRGTMVYWVLEAFVIGGMYAASQLPIHLKPEGQ